MQVSRKLAMTTRLVELLRARRRSAEVALASARAAERTAQLEEQVARDDSDAAHGDWEVYLSTPGFSPEHSQSLALRLLEREDEADAAAFRTRLAADVHARRQGDWQRLEAQTRSGKESCRALERKVRRRREEDGHGQTADLITYRWSRT